jgi:hypothetical protein
MKTELTIISDDLNHGIIDEKQARNLLLDLFGVGGSLPSLDDATKVAVRISEEAIKPSLDAKEQSLFIAGFQECIKWLNVVFSNDH